MRKRKLTLLIIIGSVALLWPLLTVQGGQSVQGQGITWCSSAFAYIDFFGTPLVSSSRGRGGSTWYSSDGTFVLASQSLTINYFTWYRFLPSVT